jgi:hypothetical protein
MVALSRAWFRSNRLQLGGASTDATIRMLLPWMAVAGVLGAAVAYGAYRSAGAASAGAVVGAAAGGAGSLGYHFMRYGYG